MVIMANPSKLHSMEEVLSNSRRLTADDEDDNVLRGYQISYLVQMRYLSIFENSDYNSQALGPKLSRKEIVVGALQTPIVDTNPSSALQSATLRHYTETSLIL